MIQDIITTFRRLYNQEPIVIRSAGRVNLIGEHTDYNEGFVLPAAIDKEIYFAIAPNGTASLRAYSYDLNEKAIFYLEHVEPTQTAWANYLLGVVAQFQRAGFQVPGFDLVFGGNIPMGAGLSSSAAVECGLGYALNHLFSFNVKKMDLVKMAQKAEHEYAGVLCGIMDQFASMFGKRNHVIQLDCRTMEYRYFPFDMRDYRLVLCDTQVKHSLASSEYNTRRQECEIGVGLLQKHYPQVNSLRDVTLVMLEQHQDKFDTIVYKRCRYVVQENLRVEGACLDLEKGDLEAFGQKMFASHRGLHHDYEVSCPELDFLVEVALGCEGVLGARMMGGGFGGCTINLVKLTQLEKFSKVVEKAYQHQFNRPMPMYIARIVDGTGLVQTAKPEASDRDAEWAR